MRSHNFASHKSTLAQRWAGRGQAVPMQQAHPVMSACQHVWIKQPSPSATYWAQCYLFPTRTALWVRAGSLQRTGENSVLNLMNFIYFVLELLLPASATSLNSTPNISYELIQDLWKMQKIRPRHVTMQHNMDQRQFDFLLSLSFFWMVNNVNIKFDLGAPPEFFILFMSVFLKHLEQTKTCFR